MCYFGFHFLVLSFLWISFFFFFFFFAALWMPVVAWPRRGFGRAEKSILCCHVVVFYKPLQILNEQLSNEAALAIQSKSGQLSAPGPVRPVAERNLLGMETLPTWPLLTDFLSSSKRANQSKEFPLKRARWLAEMLSKLDFRSQSIKSTISLLMSIVNCWSRIRVVIFTSQR